MPCFVDGIAILPPTGPLNAEVVNRMHVEAAADDSLLPPSIAIETARNQDYLRSLDKIKGISYSGGPLPEAIGSIVIHALDWLRAGAMENV